MKYRIWIRDSSTFPFVVQFCEKKRWIANWKNAEIFKTYAEAVAYRNMLKSSGEIGKEV